MTPLKSLINILLLLTLPVWGGVFFTVWIIYDAFKGYYPLTKAIRGERWLLE